MNLFQKIVARVCMCVWGRQKFWGKTLRTGEGEDEKLVVNGGAEAKIPGERERGREDTLSFTNCGHSIQIVGYGLLHTLGDIASIPLALPPTVNSWLSENASWEYIRFTTFTNSMITIFICIFFSGGGGMANFGSFEGNGHLTRLFLRLCLRILNVKTL